MDERARCIEDSLSSYFDRAHCVLVGRATTGLSLLFEALELPGVEVIYPTYSCPSPVYAAEYAGLTPQFCDVLNSDYTIDPDALSSVISKRTGAIVPVHMFGHPVDWDGLEEACEGYDVAIVEDACQAVGAKYDGRTIGSFGSASIVSFGNGKHLDAGGGGAVLTDDRSIATHVREKSRAIPVRDSERLSTLYDHYRELYYTIEGLETIEPAASKLFELFPEVFRELYMRGLPDKRLPDIEASLEELTDEIATRREHASIYRKTLSHPKVTHPDPSGSPSFYRYSVRLPDRELRDAVVNRLRDQDYHVSTLYEPLHARFGSGETCPTAEMLAARTMNLWVSSEVDETYVRSCAEAVMNAMEEFDDV